MRRTPHVLATVTILATLVVGCSDATPPLSPWLRELADEIRPEAIEQHMIALAGDSMEGRGTGSDGHFRSAEYVAAQFEAMGLRPAGDDGGWFQWVPLMRANVLIEKSSIAFGNDGATIPLEPEVDWLIRGDFIREAAEVRAEAIYVGFGVSAPDLDYDDYQGVEVEGKIVVAFQGGPPQFPGDVRAFYGSSRVKLETAVARGAIGMIQISTPDDLRRYSWDQRVADSHLGAMRWIDEEGRPHGALEAIFLEASLSERGMERLFRHAPEPVEQVIERAEDGRPNRFPLSVEVQARTATHHERLQSPNVVAKLVAAHGVVADEEFVVVTAHLDHLGIGDPVDGDRIYNGAYDNASGVATMLETAKAMTRLPEPPSTRTVFFIATTGEEKGLLGAEYFTWNPPVDFDRVVAEFNLDMLFMFHPLEDVIGFGAEHSSLGDLLDLAAGQLGIEVAPDPFPEEGVFARSDQYPFVLKGVPSLFISSGFAGGDDGATEKKWLENVYHMPADDLDQAFVFEAGADLARLNLLVLWYAASGDQAPSWIDGDFFGRIPSGSR